MIVVFLEVLQTVAIVAGASSVILVWRQLKADHERSRRERSLDLMSDWNNARYRSDSAADIVLLVEELDDKQSSSLWKKEPIEFDNTLKPIIDVIASVFNQEDSISKDGDSFILGQPLVSLMKADLTHYLNSLEIIATAWRHHAVDRDIIEEEFVAIFSSRLSRMSYDVFRKESGVYPSIHELCQFMNNKDNMRENKKPIA